MHQIAKIMIIIALLDILMFSLMPIVTEVTREAGALSGFATTLYLVAIAVINTAIVYTIVKNAEDY